MRRTCFRCDWVGDADGDDCPSCGAPLYPPTRSVWEPRRRSPAAPEMVVDEPHEASHRGRRGHGDRDQSRARPRRGRRGLPRILLLLARGEPDETDGSVGATEASVAPGRTGGRLHLRRPGRGRTARLWRWDLLGGEVTRGPVVRDPIALVNILSPGSGWLGVTSEDAAGPDGPRSSIWVEAGSVARPVGGGDIVTWTKRGRWHPRRPREFRDRCRREVDVTAVSLQPPARETVLHDTICGDVVSAGRTSLGYFLTFPRAGRVDVVESGTRTPGSCSSITAIDISPNGQMLTEEWSSCRAGRPRRTTRPCSRPHPRLGTGCSSAARRSCCRTRCRSGSTRLAYTSAGSRALAIGRQGSDGRHCGSCRSVVGLEPRVPRFPRSVSEE